MKVGSDLSDDIRRAAIFRDEIGWDNFLVNSQSFKPQTFESQLLRPFSPQFSIQIQQSNVPSNSLNWKQLGIFSVLLFYYFIYYSFIIKGVSQLLLLSNQSAASLCSCRQWMQTSAGMSMKLSVT